MTKRSTLGGGTLLALALLFVGLTVLFNYALRGWRLDLTQNHLYTTAPGTDRILKGIKEPINLYFFFSEKTADQIPQLKSYGTRVREFLEELQTRSGGNVHLHVVDPQPFSEEEDRATELGVKSAPVGATGSQFFFGLAGTNSTDGHAAIEFFDPAKEQFLEYDVVKLIYTLANPKKPVVAWLSTIPMGESLDQRTGQLRPAWAIYSQAQQLFDVREVEATTNKIDPDVSTLVIVHPKGLSPATQWAIDQYALRGGHILLFVDPLAEADPAGQGDPSNPMAAMGADKSSHFNTLLADWGVNFDPKQVVADRARALSVSMHQGEPPQQHLGILGLDSSSFNASDVVTAGLSNVNVATAGFLTPIKGATTKFESILQSSTESQPMPAQRFAMLFDPSSLREGFKPTGQRYTIAARVTGNVKTMFPSGPPTGVTLPTGQAALKESVKPLNLIVFADTDLLSDFMWVHEQNFFGQQVAQAWASNGDLVLNSLDNLSGSTDLISVRGRATFTRPFERVERLRHVADDRFHAEEQQLEQKLHETEEKLETLQSKRSDKSAIILTPEQEKELDRFQDEKVSIRKQLRQVRAGLDAEIKGLGNELKILNIVVVPFLFAVVVLLIAVGPQAAANVVRDKQGKQPMTPRRVAILLGAGVVVIGFAIWLSSKRHLDRATMAGDLVLPGLEGALNTVTEIRLTKGDETHTTLKKSTSDWMVGEREYPADSGKVRKFLLDLGALNVVEEKTHTPANYSKLGVEDTTSPQATGTRVAVVTPTKVYELIIGKVSSAKSGYVRVPTTEQALLAAPSLSVEGDPKRWLDHTLIDIHQERVKQVEEKPAEGPAYTVSREKKEQTDFAVSNIPKGRELSSPVAADPIAGALGGMTFDDVHKTAAPADAKLSHAIYHTFDGLDLDIAGRKDGTHDLITITVHSTAKETADEAQKLTTQLQGWEYELPSYKYDSIFHSMDDLLKPVEPPKKADKGADKAKGGKTADKAADAP